MGGFVQGVLAGCVLVLLCLVVAALIWPADVPAPMTPAVTPPMTPAATLANPSATTAP